MRHFQNKSCAIQQKGNCMKLDQLKNHVLSGEPSDPNVIRTALDKLVNGNVTSLIQEMKAVDLLSFEYSKNNPNLGFIDVPEEEKSTSGDLTLNYLLLSISRRAYEYGWISENELKAVIVKTRKVKKVPPALLQRENAQYEAAWERCQRILLHKTICDFFNSKGFIVNDSSSAELTVKNEGRFSTKMRAPDDRKERDLVHLYHEYRNYLKERSRQPANDPRGRFAGGAQNSANEFKERAKHLLRAITDNSVNHDRYKSDLIPLYFDPRIGAGIYLIGEDCFEPSVLDQSDFARGSVCIPCIVSFFSGILNNQDRFVYIKQTENFSTPIKAGFEMDVEMFETLDKAFEALEQQLKKYKFDRKFSYQNQSVYPPQTDMDFKRIMG